MDVKGRTIRKFMGGRGIFEPEEFFSLSNSLYEFFLGHSTNIFWDYLACKNFFHLIFFFEFFVPPPPPHKFSNGPSLIMLNFLPLPAAGPLWLVVTFDLLKALFSPCGWENNVITCSLNLNNISCCSCCSCSCTQLTAKFQY